MPAASKLNIYLHPMDGSGHIAALTGFAQTLASCGHSISFLVNIAFAGQFTKYGFNEILLYQTNNSAKSDGANEENPVKALASIIKKNLLNGKTPLQKMIDHQLPEEDTFMIELTAKMIEFDSQISKAIEKGKPDLIIVDHFLIPQAVARAGIPWIFLFSGNPLNLYRSERLPPYSSGYSTSSSPSTWTEFQSLVQTIYNDRYKLYQMQLYRHFDYNPSKSELDAIEGACFPISPFLNIYGFPEELDYDDLVPMPEKFIRVDGFCRDILEPFELPEGFQKPGKKLIYFSLGSMGSIDVELMRKITSILGKLEYNIIVSKGPLADEYELPANCYGEMFLPQTRILPIVDLVITHGGNNTVTETFAFGKPMIVLPLFADQFDNAQRIQEKGYGIRLEAYHFEEQQLLDAVRKLIEDEALKERLSLAAKRIEASNSKEKACKEIEDMVAKYNKLKIL